LLSAFGAGKGRALRSFQSDQSGMDFGKLQYLPLELRHFSALALIWLAAVVWIEVRAFRLASMRIGLGSTAAVILLLASLGGSYFNIPVAQLPERQVVSGEVVSFFGMEYVIPTVTNWPGTVIAVNVGGAVIPGLLSLYLFFRHHCGFARRSRSSSSPGCAIGWRGPSPVSA
jgi:uncharacterized membrane protein